ncbi:hypothetical protein EfmAA94_28470 (plasmid) [Enterococcus faecium]|nr:hypothetical protein EfmAA94_28470 [Enterococcus faecium]
MKELKAKAKVTQAMTRDGLTLENQATGEVENISSREAEQDLSAPGPGGTADKLLERADAIHDGHKAKKAAKQAGAVAAEGALPCTGHPPGSNCRRKNGPTRIYSPISENRTNGPISWIRPAPPSPRSASRSRKPSLTRQAAKQRPSCTLTNRTRGLPP